MSISYSLYAESIASQLESGLLSIKHATNAEMLYPNHGYARGGVGVLLATGARAGLKHLPTSKKAKRYSSSSCPSSLISMTRPSTVASDRSCSPSAGLSSRPGTSVSFNLTDPCPTATRSSSQVPDVALKEWEKIIPHPCDFQAAARSARIHDVPAQSPWACISFYENNPAEIKRHMDIINLMDQAHVQGKLEERANERARHQTWAAFQREMFRRQRQEAAAKYARAGVATRATYLPGTDADVPPGTSPATSRPTTVGTMGTGLMSTSYSTPAPSCTGRRTAWGIDSSSDVAGSMDGGAGSVGPRSISLPKPTYQKVYDRMATEAEETARNKADAWQRQRTAAARAKEHKEAEEQLRALDQHEANLRALARKNLKMSIHAGSNYIIDEDD